MTHLLCHCKIPPVETEPKLRKEAHPVSNIFRVLCLLVTSLTQMRFLVEIKVRHPHVVSLHLHDEYPSHVCILMSVPVCLIKFS